MVVGTLRREGDRYVVEVPAEEVERLGLEDGEHVSLELQRSEGTPRLADDLRDAYKIELEHGREALRYLAEH